MTGKGGDAILNVDADGVEDIPIADLVIGEFFHQLGLQLLIGNVGTSDLDIVADGGDALDLMNAFVGVGFVLVEIDGAGEGCHAVINGYFHILELRLVQLVLYICGGAGVIDSQCGGNCGGRGHGGFMKAHQACGEGHGEKCDPGCSSCSFHG